MSRRLNLMLLGGVAALTLAGCREDAPAAPEPLFVPASNAQAYNLPPLEPLAPPPAQAVSVAVPDYSYAERAYAMDRAFYDAPPDYGFSYMNAEPWAWRSTDGYEMYAEPIDDGYRYYYYEPGAEYPFFVRAPDYSYGYDSVGVVTVVYSSAGVIVPYAYRSRGFGYPDRYWRRAGDLRLAAHRHHMPVVRETWLDRRPILVNSQRPWMKAAVEQRDWRRYREHDRDRELRRFDKERERRTEEVRRDRGRDRDEVRRMQVRHDEGRGRPLFEPPRGGDRPQQRPQRDHKAERRDERPERQAKASHPDRPAMRNEDHRATRGPERPQKIAKAEQPRREVARPERVDRPQRADRPNQPQRPDRAERPDRPARNEPRGQEARPQRTERAQSPNRPDRVARDQRPERVERPARAERPQDRQAARQERPARQEKAQRGGEKPRQEARAERGGGQGRPDRQDRAGRN